MDQRNRDLLIDIRDFTRGYPHSPKLLFRNFNFKLYKHEFCVLMGKSGSGKSTLIQFLIRKLKPHPKTIYINNEDVSSFSIDEIQSHRQKIGIVFQDYQLIPTKTVAENIIYPLELKGLSEKVIKQRLEEILILMGLHDKRDEKISFLSGGEKQKVSIGRAIIGRPDYIIADEPTGNLDRAATTSIADVLIELNQKGHTILLITHDPMLLEYINSKQPTISHTMPTF
ncbi:MAG TPA: ATP-binding cassette domain-containing protein [Candidatus Absconditabacterales bacterium]|nr:ATP-binding cassette domain-containing protein [Candidatus Absconditabacterales bacterium]